MSRIRLLPPELADQIAAGEVVERPASVVKELIENALDAGARKVEVEIERGGLGRICVVDDGSGMSPEEAHLALRRHATSKLSAIEDLQKLSTMGFRGEALPSIAAVSQLALTTRRREELAGYLLMIEGGVAGEGRAVGAPPGTQVEVRGLFGNVPARLKFVKGEPTEAAHVVDTLLRAALAFPEVHFRLRSEGRAVLDLPPHASGLERARAAVGKPRQPAQLHEAMGEESGVRVEAYLGAPSESATTTRGTHLFVNRRYVRDRGLLQAVLMGYGELIERGRYPQAVVGVTLSGDAVDVNVHPQKLEVRFARAQEVYAAVRHIVAATVARAPWLSDAPSDFARQAVRVYSLPPLPRSSEAGEPPTGYEAHRRRAAEAMSLFANRSPQATLQPLGAPEPPPEPRLLASESPSPSPSVDRFFSSLIYLGQLHRTYLLCEAAGELVLIDQHAAHERVAFQRLREAHASQKVRAQRLLLPATVELDDRLAAAAAAEAPLLAELGFEVEPFGARGVVVRALPELLADKSPARVIAEVLGELTEDGGHGGEMVSERLDHLLATMACHSVVRAGDVLSEREVRALLESMDGIDYRAHCPHGRPVLLRLSIGEIERRFGRT
jgi:DNA mismatch repair protein MutL